MSKTFDPDEIEASRAPLVEHLIELRSRLVKALIGFAIAGLACFFVADEIFNLLLKPYEWAIGDAKPIALIYTAPQEYFITQLKISMFGGIFIAFPVIATQIYMFVAPGLYRQERQAFMPYLIATPILFLLGASLVYFMIMPLVMAFFASMEQTGGAGQASISLLPRVSEYLGLIMTMIMAFGICFQLPVLLTLLGRVGIVSSEGLKTKRKWAIVGIFSVAAFMTPPDLFSQIGLAVPMLLLYELSVFSVRMIERKRAEEEAAAEKEA